MPSPEFRLAQSRLLPTVIATYLLLAIWTSIHPQFLVYAADVPTESENIAPAQPILQAAQLQQDNGDSDSSHGYLPDFDYFDRSLLGRQEPQDPQPTELKNNDNKVININPGVTEFFVIKRSQSRAIRSDEVVPRALEAQGSDPSSENPVEDITAEDEANIDHVADKVSKRQAGNRVWISASTCRQPTANGTGQTRNQQQLVMFVSDSPQNQKPGPASTDNLRTPPTGLLFEDGLANFNLETSSDVYVGISAPVSERGVNGSWQFEIAASVDGPYHSYNGTDPFLFMIDTDSESALFITYNLSQPAVNDTDKWIANNPFRMYAFPADDRAPITGMERSLCALKSLSNNSTNNSTRHNVSMSVTTKFGGRLPKSQFHVQGLENGKKYNGYLTVEGSQDPLRIPGIASPVRGGGKVFKQFQWTTKADDTCQVLFDLDFCDSVAYAVPSSPEFKFDDDKLKALYDNKARDYYQNFSNSLQQIACNTNPESQYSLARTCKDCERDYKNWLCSILIPRCEDWSAPGSFLQERNVNAAFPDGSLTFGGNLSAEMNETKRHRLGYNSTRNPGIDVVKPEGPYKEMLPCEDLCFEIVKSCPAKLGFACPNSPARELSYGKRDPDDKELLCNFPGAVVKLNIQGVANAFGVQVWSTVLVAVLASALLCL